MYDLMIWSILYLKHFVCEPQNYCKSNVQQQLTPMENQNVSFSLELCIINSPVQVGLRATGHHGNKKWPVVLSLRPPSHQITKSPEKTLPVFLVMVDAEIQTRSE
jgi:hypothetical protein